MSDRMTVEEWHAAFNNGSRLTREVLWDWQNDRVELMKIADDRKGLLGRANMALLCYTQSHGTPHTQLMDEIAEELGLDADGNTLEELADD